MASPKINYVIIAPCLLAIVVDALGFGLVYPIMTALFTANPSPILSADTSSTLRHFYLGLGFMLYPFCMFFGTSFMGDLSDNLGRKKVLIICMSGIAASFLLMAWGIEFGSLTLLFLGRALSGLMAGSQPIAQAAIADISTPASKAKSMSIIALSYCVGAVLGPLIGGIASDKSLIPWFNFSTPFFIAAFLAIFAVLWLHFSFIETYQPQAPKTIRVNRPFQIFAEVFRHQAVCLLALAFFFLQVGFSLYYQFIIVLMKYAYDYSTWQLGAVNGMFGIGFGLGLLVGVPFAAKHWTIHKLAIITGLLTGLGAIAAALNHITLLQWLLVIYIATVNIMVFTSMLTLFSDSVNPNQQGWVMGIANAVMAVSWAVTGLGSNLINLIGVRGLILAGGITLILGSLLLIAPRKLKAAKNL